MHHPNVLIMYTDQQRWDALGAAGNSEIQTPNLDRLAAEGALFRNHYVQCPVCMPSRLSFLTGKYPSAFGVFNNGVTVPHDTRTLAHLFARHGYAAANIGKLHFLNHANRDHSLPHPPYGFDHLEISDEPGCYDDAYRAWARRKDPTQMDTLSVGLPPASQSWHRTMRIRDGIRHPEERFPIAPVPFAGRDDMTHTAFVGEQTVEYIRSHRDRPFFCIAGFYSPHSPWVAPRKFLDLYDPQTLTLPTFPEEMDAQRPASDYDDDKLRGAIHGYYAMVSEVDHWVGRIVQALDESGLRDETIVVFTSDHGEWLGEHLRYGKGDPGHDAVSRTPLIVRWPQGIDKTGRRIEALVEAVDVAPSLLQWAGLPVPSDLQGRALCDLAAARTDAHRDSAFSEIGNVKTVRTATHRYVVDTQGDEQLYDMQADLGQYRNLAEAPAHAEALDAHRLIMLQRLMGKEVRTPRDYLY